MTVTEARQFRDPHQHLREDLAAAFRWAARYNWHEAVANHFSMAVDDGGRRFLMNPYGIHFSRMRASDLMLLDAEDAAAGAAMDPAAWDPTAWAIHGAMHRNLPQARCVLHVHSKYATVLATLRDSSMPPIDQNTMRFHNRIAVDDGFDGMGLGDEAERLTTRLGNHTVLLMGNHGVMVVGTTVGQAFDRLYYFERACETLVTALSTGRELRVVSPEVAEKTARQAESYPELRARHFEALKAMLDEDEPDYRD